MGSEGLLGAGLEELVLDDCELELSLSPEDSPPQPVNVRMEIRLAIKTLACIDINRPSSFSPNFLFALLVTVLIQDASSYPGCGHSFEYFAHPFRSSAIEGYIF